MEPAKCKICGERHWGLCSSATPIPAKPAAVVTSKSKSMTVARSLSPVTDVSAAPIAGKKGRRLAKEAHLALSQLKPWAAEGMSRATWYRRARKVSHDQELGARRDVSASDPAGKLADRT